MTRPSLISLLFAAFSLACATRPAATPASSATPATQAAAPTPAVVAVTMAMNPVGTFDFTAIGPDGSASNGSFTITGSAGAYTGTISREGVGSTDLASIAVDGQTMTLNAMIPEGAVILTLTFTGNDFTGSWSLPAESVGGAISGKRR